MFVAYTGSDKHTVKSIPHAFSVVWFGFERLDKKETSL